MENFPNILSIFFTEFHPIQGPQVLFEVPEGFVTKRDEDDVVSPFGTPLATQTESLEFDSISEYLIPKKELCNQLVTVSTTLYRVMGYPVLIEDPKYVRNSLLFNLCFVFEKHADTSSYDQVVSKVARELRCLEIDSEFLHNPVTKASLGSIVEQIFDDLNSYHECQILISDANTLNLKLFPNYPSPPMVHDYDVPVATLELGAVMDKHWDLVLQRIVDLINGFNSVKRISILADADIALVRLAIRHLLYYGCVRIIDIFQFSNVYRVTTTIHKFVKSLPEQQECSKFVTKPGKFPIPFSTLFRLYCSFRSGQMVSQWIQSSNLSQTGIDPRRFIVFGVLNGYLARTHEYPLLYHDRLRSYGIEEKHVGPVSLVPPVLLGMLDGDHHLDCICTKLSMSNAEIKTMLAHLYVSTILK